MTKRMPGFFTRQLFTLATSVAVIGLTGLMSSQATAAETLKQERADQIAALEQAIARAIQTQVRSDVSPLETTVDPSATAPQEPYAAPSPVPTPVPAPAPAPQSTAPLPVAPAPVDAVTAGS